MSELDLYILYISTLSLYYIVGGVRWSSTPTEHDSNLFKRSVIAMSISCLR